MTACCAPPGGARSEPTPTVPQDEGVSRRDPEEMVLLPGGEFLMGTEDSDGFTEDGEGPVRRVRVSPFLIDTHAVGVVTLTAGWPVDSASERAGVWFRSSFRPWRAGRCSR
ncbi:SUMF1/EgtB/PvdO family nonheme iron enzyme [Streptomyces sp. NPDC048496]|uniref:SUMF1/EgtB/PvdO family nonheme iron enzyme n=1 Tax=Streptomyces sp. NPDC048496 TaxID=3365558 RepID=UPI00371F3BB8